MNGQRMQSETLVLRLAYDGSRFFGSQYQPDAITVQGEVEGALRNFHDPDERVRFAGRTDRGVHATGQVASCAGPFTAPIAAVVDIARKRLGPDIVIRSWTLAHASFEPRHDALSRTYRYILRPGAAPSPFLDRYSLTVSKDLDWEIMGRACELFVGEHEFIAFATRPSEQTRLRRCLDECRIEDRPSERHVVFRARSFLRGQIRNMMGALLALGQGRSSLEALATLLEAREKPEVPKPASPVGLYLEHVEYGDNHFLGPFRGFHPEERP